MDNNIFNKKYQINGFISKGGFGAVYHGINKKTNTNIAIKIEKENPNNLLIHEATILNYLNERHVKGIPLMYWFGNYISKVVYKCIVQQLYNKSSVEFFSEINSFTLLERSSKITVFFDKCIDILEYIHTEFIIHRDIKPQNFMLSDNMEPVLIDFGFSTFYVDENENHIPNMNHPSLIGSPLYISLNIHNQETPSRRDDIISLIYMYIEVFYRRELPWKTNKDMPIAQQKQLDNILKFMCNINSNIIKFVYELTYKTKPNYFMIKQLMSTLSETTTT